MDWTNFALFAMTYITLSTTITLNDRDRLVLNASDCSNPLCAQIGFYDLWEVFNTARNAKFYMSICVCIQLLKIIKFTNVIIPKMSLMTRVLAKGCYDLIFFGVIFAVSMFAFCMLFYIQLGAPAASECLSLATLFRAPRCAWNAATIVLWHVRCVKISFCLFLVLRFESLRQRVLILIELAFNAVGRC